MSEEKLEQAVLSGLLHDVGKLFERGHVEEFRDVRDDSDCMACCPRGRVGMHETHIHSAYTMRFCQWLEKRFSILGALPDEWKTWCAAHHLSDPAATEARVIKTADQLSSSEREEGTYDSRKSFRRTLLEPVIERVYLARNHAPACRHRYRLERTEWFSGDDHGLLCADNQGELLHVMDNAGGAVEPKNWSHLITHQDLTEEYTTLGKGLLTELDAVAKWRHDLSIEDLLITLETLLERYTGSVPSATNVRHPDISLFDHLRTTAAIAQCLYLHHKAHPGSSIDSRGDFKWLLVCGDFTGVQKFIYNLTNKGAAKGLRGRSLYVHLLCRLLGEQILRKLGLLRNGILYNSGGKFYVLIPAHFKDVLFKEIRPEINQWLLKEFDGDVFLGLGSAPVSGAMFAGGAIHGAWKEAARTLEQDRVSRFREQLTGAFFEPRRDFDPTKSCGVCGARTGLHSGAPGREVRCDACETMEAIGRQITGIKAVLAVWKGGDRLAGRLDCRPLLELHGGAQVYFLNDKDYQEVCHKDIQGVEAHCILVNEQGDCLNKGLPSFSCALSSLSVARWEAFRMRHEQGDPWNFDDYANESRGIKRLGILRMDVDCLGEIFSRGLHFRRRENNGWGEVVLDAQSGDPVREPMASISRMATLSRQMDRFFSARIPALLEKPEFNKCQVIYAGGDDLFIIGSWHQLPDLAQRIREDFRGHCCGNPDLSISGGMTLQRGKYPIYRGAKVAGLEEEKGKEVRKHWEAFLGPAPETLKDGFAFMGTSVPWKDFAKIRRFKEMLEDESKKNMGLFSFLRVMHRGNEALARTIHRREGIPLGSAWQRITYESWRWKTAYQLRRRFSGSRDEDELTSWAAALFCNRFDNIAEPAGTLPVFVWMGAALRWAEYLHRNEGGKS